MESSSPHLAPAVLVVPPDERPAERGGAAMRGRLPLLVISALGLVAFGGTLLERDRIGQELHTLRQDLSRVQHENHELTMMSASLVDRLRLIEDGNTRWAQDHGIFPVRFLREKSHSVVPVVSVWDPAKRDESHSSGVHLGDGYFLTVKHGIFRGRFQSDPVQAQSTTVVVGDRQIPVRVVDTGEARSLNTGNAWGDWAVIRAREPVELAPLTVALDYPFDFGDPIARIGNDWGKGILFATGYLGRKMSTGLYSSLTATHTGVSGGPVIDSEGRIVAIAVGKQRDGDNFAYIQPIVPEMFRRVPHLRE